MDDILAPLATLLLPLFFLLIVFLIIRQLVLWYWRLNEIADSVVYIADHFRAIDQEAGRVIAKNTPVPRKRTPQEIEDEKKLNLFGG